ncbi:MAG: low molecular weight phosphotyrosine protein phosphatase [Bacteroidales bacterium]|nr:low molecular weight phosphotyrosine protein phosphatase [Candidatus Sodaliphilus aphodohippi]
MEDNGKYGILFVCLGNICRSPAAEGVFGQLVEEEGLSDRFDIDSAGTYSGHRGQLPDQRMLIHARRRGLELTHRSRPIEVSDFERFDMIVAMDSSNRYDLEEMAPTPSDKAKIVMMGDYIDPYMRTFHDYVPDPYYEGSEGFELVLDLLEGACQNLLDYIVKNKLK